MRFAASVPGGMGGKCVFRRAPSHQRNSAPRLDPTLTAAIDLHIASALVPWRAERAQPHAVCCRSSQGEPRKEHLMPELRTGTAVLLLLTLPAALTGACSQQARQHAADERFRVIYETEWRWRKEQLPGGEDDSQPPADYLPKVDPASEQQRLEYWEETLRKVNARARADLSPAGQVNYDIYRAQLQVLIDHERFRDFEMPANSDSTFWTDLGYTARRPFRTLADYQHWI